MSFVHHGALVHLNGILKLNPTYKANLHQLQRLVEIHAIDTYLQLLLFYPKNLVPPPETIPTNPYIHQILTKFSILVKNPSTLPP